MRRPLFRALHLVFPELKDIHTQDIMNIDNVITINMLLHKDFGGLQISLDPTVGFSVSPSL